MSSDIKKLYHGTAYYPELWDKSLIDEDIRLMKEAGINMVRIGEFWWSTIEPHEGEYHTDYIIHILDKMHENGIDVCMCTPTPTPPIWLTYGHPERMHMDTRGRMIHGGRQQICTNNEDFRAAAMLVIDKISEAVGNHPAIVLWQLDNEFKCHIRECFCELCLPKWHSWLRKKYGTIESLNDAWGTRIWSQWYQSFEQIPQPSPNTPFQHSPSIKTMYKLFHREKIAEFASLSAEAVRKHSQAPITTNGGMGFGADNDLLFENLDTVGFSAYSPAPTYYAWIANCDIWRGIKKTRPFWNLETTASHTGAIDRLATPHPAGYLVPEAVALYALGGAGFTYWLWRQQWSGCEISHSAVVSAWGKPGVGWNDVLAVAALKDEIEPFILSTKLTPAKAAITYSDRARVFMDTENHKNNDYRGMMTILHKQILEIGLHRDMLPENQNLDGYNLLITPLMWCMTDEYFSRAKAFVEAGGTWIIGPVTGGRTPNHTVTTDSALGGEIEAFAGVTARCTYSIDNTDAIGEAFGISAPLTLWSTPFIMHDATAVGYMRGGLTPDEPFITEAKRGRGKVVMIGSMPTGDDGNAMWQRIIGHYASEAGCALHNITPGTIAIPRHNSDNNYLVLVNLDGKGGTYCGKDAKEIKITPYGWRILEL